jgi:hypothetical protein
VNDSVWSLANQPGQFPISDQYEVARSAINTGDRRIVCILRLIDAAEAAAQEPSFRTRHQAKLQEWIKEISRNVQSCKAQIVHVRFEKLANMSL